MPTRKISEPAQEKKCMHPDHGVPMFQHFEPGTYEHTCPSCGEVKTFTVKGTSMKNSDSTWKVGKSPKPTLEAPPSIH